jgi:hypothetical protein
MLSSSKVEAAAADTSLMESSSSPFENLPVGLLSYILSFVGKHQYRFVAMINQNFREVYLNNNEDYQSTYVNASTVELAKFCWEDRDHLHFHVQRIFCKSAAKHGCLPALQYLLSRDSFCCYDTCAMAARNGHFHVVEWCYLNGCLWNEGTCTAAAYGGHLNILQWCHERGCPWNEQTCAGAAYGGHLNMLQWCREQGCPWNAYTCANAAQNVHLNVLQWC